MSHDIDRELELKALGKRIRQFRLMKGWTQEDLGSRLDMEYQNVSRLERGLTSPSYITLILLASILEIEIQELFVDSKEA